MAIKKIMKTSESVEMITKKQISEALVVQHNALIESCYSMSLNEKRLLILFISQIRRDENGNCMRKMLLSVKDFEDFFNTKITPKEMNKTIDNFFRQSVKIRTPFTDSSGYVWKSGAQFTLLTSALYGEASIQLSFNAEMMPVLEELKNNFTTYALKESTKLKSTYSIRFYEMFRQYEKIGERTFTLAEIRKMFGLENKYKDRQNLFRRVIASSVEDINKNSSMNVFCEPTKKGQKITGYKFTFHTVEASNEKKLKDFLKKVKPIFSKDEKIVVGGQAIHDIGEGEGGELLAVLKYENKPLLEMLIKNNFEFSKINALGQEILPYKKWSQNE